MPMAPAAPKMATLCILFRVAEESRFSFLAKTQSRRVTPRRKIKTVSVLVFFALLCGLAALRERNLSGRHDSHEVPRDADEEEEVGAAEEAEAVGPPGE